MCLASKLFLADIGKPSLSEVTRRDDIGDDQTHEVQQRRPRSCRPARRRHLAASRCETDFVNRSLRLLDADATGIDWRITAQLVLSLDPAADLDRAQLVYDAHLAQARRMTRVSYRLLLKSYFAGRVLAGQPGSTNPADCCGRRAWYHLCDAARRIAGQSRADHRRPSRLRPDDAHLRAALRATPRWAAVS